MEDVLRTLKVPRRAFGRTGVTVSTITYGTMRLLPERFSEDAILDLFLYALDAGITTYHVSHEYESYPAVCRALRRARAERPSAIEIVAKIGQPHFDEVDFDSDRFQLLIERTLADLDVPTVDIVQWLVRHTPNEDAPRIAILERNADSIESLWSDLLTIGRVRALGVFPYSDAFLQSALKLPCVDGVVSYYNERERELEPFFDALAMAGRSILGIRPLCAGSIREEADALKALQFALAPEPPVAGTIIGLSSRAQIDAAIASALTVRR